MKDFKVIPFDIHNSLFDIRYSVTVQGVTMPVLPQPTEL